MRKGLEVALCNFIRRHAESGPAQKGAAWRDMFSTTVGGSEIAALMGCNSYRSYNAVVKEKALLAESRGRGEAAPGMSGGIACWWGSLFEDVAADLAAAELGAPVLGTDICIRSGCGRRRYSPDGYAVVTLCDPQTVWTAGSGRPPGDQHAIALLEFKCPFSREPDGTVPRNYAPQVWTGLEDTPIAAFGLFVDSVFRRCRLADLGAGPAYEADLHPRDPDRSGDDPGAWGLVAVFCPRRTEPRHVRFGWRGPVWAPGDPVAGADTDICHAVEEMRLECPPTPFACGGGAKPLMDLGGAPARVFKRALRLIDCGRLVAAPLHRQFCWEEEERGLPSGADFAARAAALGGGGVSYEAVAVLPWKLFRMQMTVVERRPRFRALLDELTERALRDVEAAVASGNAAEHLGVRGRAGAGAADAADEGFLEWAIAALAKK